MLLLLKCLRHNAVEAINTLWLVVFIPVNVSFWFPVWEEKNWVNMKPRNPVDNSQFAFAFAFAFVLLLWLGADLMLWFGADESQIKQSGLSVAIVELDC